MRLTCPNCDAQYEVPDDAIPPAGRDVQCSNCSNTWYQPHPDETDAAPDAQAKTDAPPAEVPSAPERRRLDPEVADILREEAEHETRLRSSEARGGLESQPDLDLDAGLSAALKWRKRTARKAGAIANANAKKLDPQHNLLPDLDEISSTLLASERVDQDDGDTGDPDAPQQSGFILGLGVILLLAVGLLLIYTNAGRIALAVPQAEPALAAYSQTITDARIWLDSVVTKFTSR